MLSVLHASMLPPPKMPSIWIYQRPPDGFCFWDSFLHRECEEVRRQTEYPFKESKYLKRLKELISKEKLNQ